MLPSNLPSYSNEPTLIPSLEPSLEMAQNPTSNATGADSGNYTDASISTPDTAKVQAPVQPVATSVLVVNTGADRTRSSLNAPWHQLDRQRYPVLYVQRRNETRSNEVITRQAVLRMDLTGLPSDATVLNATLRLFSTLVNEPIQVAMHRLKVAWEEQESVNGGIFGTSIDDIEAHTLLQADGLHAAVNPSNSFLGIGRTTLEIDVLSDVQYWATAPNQNFGWLFQAKEGEFGRWGMWSLESVSKPELTIEYT